MILDARHDLPDGDVTADVAILGGGPAGIALALTLADASVDTVLLEAGGLVPSSKAADLLRGSNRGVPYLPLHTCRLACLGGTTDHWTGWCRPLDPVDFEPQPDAPLSGWPFGYDQLRDFYERAAPWFELEDDDFEIPGPHAPAAEVWPLGGHPVESRLFRFSPPTHFGHRYRDEMHEAEALRVYLNASAIDLDGLASGGRVRRIHVGTAGGERFVVRARLVVLAMGGIENARMLLQTALGGGEDDYVGRCFMEHAFCYTGWFEPEEQAPMRLYAVPEQDGERRNEVVAALGLGRQAQLEHGLNNAYSYLLPRRPDQVGSDYNGPGMWATFELAAALRRGERPEQPLRRLREAVLDAPAVARSVARSFVRRPSSRTAYGVRTCVEQSPDSGSRVGLARRARDRWGRPRAELDWRLGPRSLRTLRTSAELIREALEGARLGRVQLFDDRVTGSHGWPATLTGGSHHMGTTRMHQDPRLSVVDSDCRVLAADNLYVAGSSVFPTGGASNPTLTIVALALRLADHLTHRLR